MHPRTMFRNFFLGSVAAAFAAAPPAMAGTPEPQDEWAGCGTLIDAQLARSLPAPLAARIAFAHEIAAAGKCASAGDSTAACGHYRKAIAAAQALDAGELEQARRALDERMAEIGCR